MEVEVIRYLRTTEDVILIVKPSGRPQIAVPEWMLDPEACQQLTTETTARIAVAALVALRQLIDSQILATASAGRGGAGSPSGGRVFQRRLRFDDPEVWAELPEAVREQCRALWGQMLTAVLRPNEEGQNDGEV